MLAAWAGHTIKVMGESYARVLPKDFDWALRGPSGRVTNKKTTNGHPLKNTEKNNWETLQKTLQTGKKRSDFESREKKPVLQNTGFCARNNNESRQKQAKTDGEGFEPTDGVNRRRFSRPVP